MSMFENERKMIHKYFDYFQKKFGEEVNIMTGVLEEDDIAIDLLIGDSEEIRGVRVFKIYEQDEEDDEDEDDEEDEENDEDEEEEEAPVKKKTSKASKKVEEKPEEEEDEDDDEDEEESPPAEVFDLLADPKATIQGKPFLQVYLADIWAEDEDDEEEHDEECECDECQDDEKEEEEEPVKKKSSKKSKQMEEEEEEEPEEEEDGDKPKPEESIELTLYSEDGTMDTKIICAVMKYLKENDRQEVYILDPKLFKWQVICI